MDIDENATWPGLDTGDLDAVLEVWPSGHVDDYATYVEEKGTVVDIGELGPDRQDRLVRAGLRARGAP